MTQKLVYLNVDTYQAGFEIQKRLSIKEGDALKGFGGGGGYGTCGQDGYMYGTEYEYVTKIAG